MKNISDRLGETTVNNQGFTMFIIEYNNSQDIKVQFKDTGEVVKARYEIFKSKMIKSHFSPSLFGFGIVGLEKCSEKGEQYNSYRCWKSMIQRCYSIKCLERHPTYNGCTVCEEWQYYKNFKEWYDINYYEINSINSQLDKDILIKGNQMYGPNTCVFTPSNINALFIKSDKIRGDLPIGLTLSQSKKKYRVSCKDNKENKGNKRYLGRYNTIEKAFEVYKKYKENIIKTTANEYKRMIPIKLYDALINYEVEITD